jgi:hypothetical protein
MCENIVICVKICLTLDIGVKYAQCVKIWLFLKCVQFLKSCVQFIMDTILNLAIDQFLMKKKGRETRPRNSHLVSQECASPFYLTCTKKYL